MIKQTVILLTIVTGILVTNCNNENQNLSDKTKESQMKNFVVPDSINKALIVAMYDEQEPAGHSLLVYNDTNRTSARKITYFSNREPSVESIIPIKYNEFSTGRADYLIKEKTVITCYKGYYSTASLSFNWTSENKSFLVHEDARTDR